VDTPSDCTMMLLVASILVILVGIEVDQRLMRVLVFG
jgi:hypothetical protein